MRLTIAKYGILDLSVLLPEGAALELEILRHFDASSHNALLKPTWFEKCPLLDVESEGAPELLVSTHEWHPK
jgi:hypothetical protein